MLQKIGGRKVVFGLLIIAVGVVVHIFASKGLTAEMVELLTFIGVGFFMGNGIERISESVKKRKPTAEAAELMAIANQRAVEISNIIKSVSEEMSLIKQQNAILGEQNKATQEAISYIIKAAGLEKAKKV